MGAQLRSEPKDIVFFDGECVICNGFFHFLLKRDKHHKLYFGTLQSETTKSFIAENYRDKIPPDSLLMWHNNKMYIKSSASLYAIATLGGPWKLVKGFFIFPAFWRNFFYNIISKNRYKWWKKKECLVPEEGWKERFI